MCFYVATENLNIMMKENHNTESCEYIIICQDGLYIVSTTPEDILHMLKDKYKINIYIQDKYPLLVEKINIKSRKIWNSCRKMLICFSTIYFQQIYILNSKLSSY